MNIVKLIAYTKVENDDKSPPHELMAYCARVSNPANQNNTQTAEKLLNYCIDHKHWSVFEMANVVMEINTTRDIARQILRHRSFHFQEFCVSENTEITTIQKCGKSKKVKIKDLFKRQNSKQYSKLSDGLVRVFDDKSKTFISAKIKEVFDTGVKPIYRVVLDNGKSIDCTDQHKLLAFDGYKRVEDISVGDFVACNGIPMHQDRNWLLNAKQVAIQTGGGLSAIAEMADVSYHTIRKWLKRHKLQFTKNEVASYTQAWNKELPKEQQPRFGKFHDEETRMVMSNSAKFGSSSNLFKSGNYSRNTISWRKRVAAWCGGFRSELMIAQNYICPISGKKLTKENSEIDHIQPVCFRPDLAFEKSNLQVLHKDAHREKTKQEKSQSKYTVTYSAVKSIDYVGEEQTYDMEVDHTDHNYIANGIVTHNSQRYADPDQLGYEIREVRLQDSKNRQNSIEVDDPDLAKIWNFKQEQIMHECKLAYKWAIENGIAKEQARAVLPEGLVMSRIYVSGTVRDWFHYCQLRMGPETQKEHRLIAHECWDILCNLYPFLKDR